MKQCIATKLALKYADYRDRKLVWSRLRQKKFIDIKVPHGRTQTTAVDIVATIRALKCMVELLKSGPGCYPSKSMVANLDKHGNIQKKSMVYRNGRCHQQIPAGYRSRGQSCL